MFLSFLFCEYDYLGIFYFSFSFSFILVYFQLVILVLQHKHIYVRFQGICNFQLVLKCYFILALFQLTKKF